MTLRRLLRLLPLGLVLVVGASLGMLALQHRESRTTFDQLTAAQRQRDAVAAGELPFDDLALSVDAGVHPRGVSEKAGPGERLVLIAQMLE